MRKLIALFLSLALLLAAMAGCGKQTKTEPAPAEPEAPATADTTTAPADPDKPFKKFDHVVEVHTALKIDPTAVDTLLDGDTAEDNYYTRYFLDNYNIKIVVDWSASVADYDQKLSLAIASNTLPDAFVSSAQYWKAASKAGLLKDLSGVYDEYAGETIKTMYDSTKGLAMEDCMYDDEMTGLTGITVETEGIHVMMIREDWLNKLGLKPPQTIKDLEAVAQAFKDAGLGGENSIAILGASNSSELYSTFDATFACTFGFDPIFAAKHAYPGYFYQDEAGKVVYGSTTKEYRDSLELLARWYKMGLIDPEIGTRTTDMEPVNSGQAGIFFGPWWTIGYGNPSSFENDPEADWQAYQIYDDNGKWNVKQPENFGTLFMCVNEKATDEVAQACMIIQNVSLASESAIWNQETTEDVEWSPLRLAIGVSDICEHNHDEWLKILDGKAEPEDYAGDTLYDSLYPCAQVIRDILPNYTSDRQLHRSDFVMDFENTMWQPIYSMLIGDRPYAESQPDYRVKTLITDYTPAMEMYWDNLKSLEKSTALSIIVGQSDISEFDKFVDRWMAEGGSTVLDEISATIQ